MLTRRYVLAAPVADLPHPNHFRLETVELPAPGEGEILVRNEYISVDPGMRGRLSGVVTYAPPLGIGEVIEAATVGEVLVSRHPKFAVGDHVVAGFGWQEHALSNGRGVRRIPDDRLPRSLWIGILGIPGLTAYFGMLEIGRPQAGETVLVTSAAGPVGATAGQLARRAGCRVVGVAGGRKKCTWLGELGFDAVVDYKAAPDLGVAIAALCKDGVDVLFDNVGNAMIDRVLPIMRPFGRIVVSGQIADYNVPPEARVGITNTIAFIGQRLTMRGFVAFDYAKEFPRAWADLGAAVLAGELQYREDIEDGFEHLPEAFIGLFAGANFGRKLIRTA
jgi:NADPH-dependent curcumin reductase CurA